MIFSESIRSISRSAIKWLIGFYLLSLMAMATVLRLYLHKNMQANSPGAQELLQHFDQLLVYSFWFFLFLAIFFTYLFITSFFAPLAPLIEKAKAIKKGQYNFKSKEVVKESRGEWFQLELALNKISKDLKKRKADVEKERGELEAVITAANDAILAVDKDMNIRYYNAPMATFFDQKEEGNWGKKLHEVIRNSHIIEAFEKSIQEQKPQRVQTSQEISLDSSLHFFEISVSPFLDEKKMKTRGAVAIFHDITEHKKVEKVRMDFVANASHELKTPLTSVQGYLHQIKESCIDLPNTKEMFTVVESNLARLNHLISDLLELSKIESAESVQKDNIETLEITESVIYDLRGRIKEKNHELFMVYDQETVYSNRDLLEHVMINLIENAVKYCPEGSSIKVRWGLDDDFHFLSIKDNGPGIESYHQGRLFERFYRVRDEKSQDTKGTGLGLSIVRNALQKLGGHVDVKSAPGLGSEFICYFPIK